MSNNRISFQGKEYDSIKQLCDEYNVKRTTYIMRIKRGLSIEEALLTPISIINVTGRHKYHRVKPTHGKPIVYNGKEYISISEAARDNNMTYMQLHYRLVRAKSTHVRPTRKPTHKKSIVYNGKDYKSMKQLCTEHNIDYNLFRNRLAIGWTIEDALTHTKNTHVKPTHGKPIVYNGKEYISISEAARDNNMTYMQLYRRIKPTDVSIFES